MRWYLVGSLVLVALAGCGRGFMFAEREPWRHEAEVACLKSGAVREGAGLVRVAPIEGPGICGADFPLKVAALGESLVLGFVGEPPRPPAAIPGGALPRWPIAAPRSVVPGNIPPAQSSFPGEPLQLGPPLSQNSEYGNYTRAPKTVPLGPRAPQATSVIGPVEIKPAATLACPVVSALDQWIAQAVQPAAQRWFGQPVAAIKQISAYSCRGMNGQPGARISEHAFGNALDVAAFIFADGRSVTVKDGWRGLPEEQGFLRDVQAAACEQFTTVLAPGANSFHYDHIHVDLMRRSSGRRICQPGAVDGELVAARALKRAPALLQSNAPAVRRPEPFNPRNDPYAWRGAAVQRGDPVVTGSIHPRRQPGAQPIASDEDHDWIEDDGPRPK